MTAEHENFLSMLLTVKVFGEMNDLELGTELPAWAAEFLIYLDKVNNFSGTASVADLDLTGYAEAKEQAGELLLNLTHQVGTGAANYFRKVVPDPSKVRVLDWKIGELQNMRDTELSHNANETWKLANPVKALLVPYTVSSADVDDLTVKQVAYQNLISVPQYKIGDRASLKKDLIKMKKDINDYFDNTLDPLVEPLRTKNSLLFDKYQAARNIVDAPGGSGGGSEVVVSVPANSTVNVNTQVASISNSTPIEVEKVTVFAGLGGEVYFSAVAAGEPGAGSVGEVYDTVMTFTAGAIGFVAGSSPYLNIRNKSAQALDFRVLVG